MTIKSFFSTIRRRARCWVRFGHLYGKYGVCDRCWQCKDPKCSCHNWDI